MAASWPMSLCVLPVATYTHTQRQLPTATYQTGDAPAHSPVGSSCALDIASHSGGSTPERTAPCGVGAVRFARADCCNDSKSDNTWASSVSGGGGGRPVLVVGLGGVIAPEAP